jgi:gamma-glutamyltranspeptidase/glutathione hydrolase
MRFAFVDRNNKLGDPDFVDNPIELLTSKNYAKKIRARIQPDHANVSAALTPSHSGEKMQTTHYSVIDKDGNAVAVTYTLNGFFGAGIIAGNTGFFLNNEMDDFSAKPGVPNQFGLVENDNNSIQPGKRPLSSMTPTIVLKHNKPVLIVGSPGGSRIITSVLETIINVLDFDMDVQSAVDAPRFHHQWLPDWVEVEPETFSPDVTKKLSSMGYSFKDHEPWGAVEAIYADPKTRDLMGGSDKRRVNGGIAAY